MKMILDMSFEDGMNVVKALRECAINNGWDKNELDECGVVEEYTSAVDAALTALGISVSIDSEPKAEPEPEVEDDDFDEVDDFDVPKDYLSEFDDNDDDDDDDDEEDTRQYSLTPKGEFVVRAVEAGASFENACKIADFLFDDNEGE